MISRIIAIFCLACDHSIDQLIGHDQLVIQTGMMLSLADMAALASLEQLEGWCSVPSRP